MGRREPEPLALAPRLSLDQLLWVANTRHGPGGHWFARVGADAGDHDHLADAADARDYLGRHHVPLPDGEPTAAQLARLVAIREMIRALVDRSNPPWPADAGRILASTRFVADADGQLRATGSGWDALIGDLMLPLIALVRQRDHLRVCGNPHCRLVFLDLTRNHSRRWCDNGGCGNRDRVHRYRRAVPQPPPNPVAPAGDEIPT